MSCPRGTSRGDPRPTGSPLRRSRPADLGRMRVAVVGLGGIGSILVESLARLGVGALMLVDNDVVDETNLPRLVAARADDVGKPKTVPAVRNARRANAAIGLTILPER